MQISLRDSTIKFKDGDSEEVELKVGDGNLTFTERQNIEYTRDRGQLDTVRQMDDEPLDVSFDFVWSWLKGSTLASTSTDAIRDIIKGNDPYATTGGDCEPYACDIEITIAPELCSGDTEEVITLSDFRFEELSYDIRAGSVSATGKCNITEPSIA